MRGISPVIAMVLLLLAAVAAVGGAWVWYQRLQAGAQTGGQAGVEKISASTSVQYTYVDRAYISGSNLVIEFGNQGSDTVNITAVKVKTYTGSYDTCTTTSFTIPANNVHETTCSGTVGTASGDVITIKAYFKGGTTKEFTTSVE